MKNIKAIPFICCYLAIAMVYFWAQILFGFDELRFKIFITISMLGAIFSLVKVVLIHFERDV